MSSIPPTKTVVNPKGALPPCRSDFAFEAATTRTALLFQKAGIPIGDDVAALVAHDIINTFLAHVECAYHEEPHGRQRAHQA